jgi:hypothetical protein
MQQCGLKPSEAVLGQNQVLKNEAALSFFNFFGVKKYDTAGKSAGKLWAIFEAQR